MKGLFRDRRVFGSIFLVSGTTVGAGMLAFPTTTGIAGFFPALILFFIVWAFLLMSSFLFLEVNLCFNDKANLTSMAERTLGSWAKWSCVVCYLFLLYCLITVYLSGVAALLDMINTTIIPSWMLSLIFVTVFGYTVYMGTNRVDFFNRLFIAGLGFSYLAFVFFALPNLKMPLLMRFEPKYLPLCFTVMITAFGYHIIIPTLKEYLKGDVKSLKISIFIGSLVPLMAYILWNFLFLAILPKELIISAYHSESLPIEPLKEALSAPSLSLFASLLSFFVIITSFLGVALSLNDFLADLFKIKKDRQGRLLLAFITFMPPLAFVITEQKVFYTALRFGGALVAILLGVFPCLMAWRHRLYRKKLPYKAPINSFMIWVSVLFFSLAVVVNLLQQAGLITLEGLMR